MTTDLVKVDFHGDTLEAAQSPDGKVWVSLRRCCENLGLDLPTQLRKLKGKPWACMGEMPIHDVGGRQQSATCVDLETLPGWLFSIDARKVKEEIREKLARYQREAARVLADAFLGRSTSPSGVSEHFLEALFCRIEEKLVPHLVARLAERAPRPEPCHTIRERVKQLGWETCSPRQRDQIRQLALVQFSRRGLDRPVKEATAPGAELLFPESSLWLLDDAIVSVWDDARRVDNRPLFDLAK